MADREIIHSARDVPVFIKMAHERGLVVRVDAPTECPKPDIATADRLATLDRGVFILFRPEWVFGEPQFQRIPGGHNEGKYSQSPGVNVAPITAYFGGERRDGVVRRLGGGTIGWNNRWYDARFHIERPAPPDVKAVYDSLLAASDTGVYLSGGVHEYLVLRDALQQLEAGAAAPPFDYIEWPPPPDVTDRKTRRRAKKRK